MKNRIRYTCTFILANLLVFLGFVRRAKAKALRGEHILSIYFHKPSAEEFENCLRWLKSNSFKAISLDDFYRIVQKQLPFPKGAVLLTADDGWRSNKTNIVAIAEKYKVPVTIFVATEPIEKGNYWWTLVEEAKRRKLLNTSVKYLKKVPNEERLKLLEELAGKVSHARNAMTVEEIQHIALSPQVTIGAHTVSHPILSNCNSKQAYSEIEASKHQLQTWTGKSVDYFAYPNGDYTEREVRMLEELGYKLAFTVRPSYISPAQLNLRYELPRFEVIENAPFAETICRMVGVWEPLMLRLKHLGTRKTSMAVLPSPDMEQKQSLGYMPPF